MRILVSNDDGVYSPGIAALAEVASEFGTVRIVAPEVERSSMGHAITEALVRHIGGFVVHMAGSFHVEKGTGIPERIADYRPGTRVTSVVMTKVDDIDAWSEEDHGALGDYVVLTKKPQSTDGN